MFGQTFYHAMTRKYVSLFGTLFNDIRIERPSDGPTQIFKVPITYSSQDKMLARLFSDPDLDRKASAFTPAMSFMVGSPKYDSERKLQTTLTRCVRNDDGSVSHQYVPVPYNLEFTLFIYSREQEDGLRILEQILPYFTPSFTVTIQMTDDVNYKADVPIILDDIDFLDDSYGEVKERRRLIWTLKFTMKAEYIGPVANDRKIIRIVHANIRDIDNREVLEEVHVEPGLTANGTPTSVREDSVDVTLINPTDDFGYIVDINEGPIPHP